MGNNAWYLDTETTNHCILKQIILKLTHNSTHLLATYDKVICNRAAAGWETALLNAGLILTG